MIGSPLGDCADRLMELYGKARSIIPPGVSERDCEPELVWRGLVELVDGEGRAKEMWRCIELAVDIYRNTPAFLQPLVLAAASQYVDRRDLETALKSFNCFDRTRAWLKEKGIF